MGFFQVREIPRSIIFWGGTGQAKVMRSIVEHYGSFVAAVFDDTPELQPPFPDVELFLGWDGYRKWVKGRDRSQIGFCLTIGNPHGRIRLRLENQLIADGVRPVTLVHPAAFVDRNVQIGEGCQIHAGAIVIAESTVGRQCIINTKSSVDHECVLEDGVEIAPGATLCGCVRVGVAGWVCAGATILPRVHVGHDAIVGAGAVVTRHVPDGVTVVGCPAGPIERRRRE
jgi:sugar O-acyltransferase (sialic acid O-acetyltransferase NeuD family)